MDLKFQRFLLGRFYFSFFRLLRQICIFSWKCSFFFIKKRRKIELTFTVGSYCLLSLFLSFLGFCFTLSGFFCRIFFRKSQFLLFQFFLQLSDLLCPFLRPDLSAEFFLFLSVRLCLQIYLTSLSCSIREQIQNFIHKSKKGSLRNDDHRHQQYQNNDHYTPNCAKCRCC